MFGVAQCISQDSLEKHNQSREREIYYKELAHTIMKADKSKICSVSQQTEEFDGVVLV